MQSWVLIATVCQCLPLCCFLPCDRVGAPLFISSKSDPSVTDFHGARGPSFAFRPDLY